MRLFLCILLWAGATAVLAESSEVSGSGPLSASASIDFRIIIPPRVDRMPDGALQPNFRESSGWQYNEGENGVITLSNP